ncbi:MAG: hypothetical protein HRT34_15070, partial [Alcanivorax sp.]|nr:hypothetical protein [Alcanivorax sp.]
NVYNRVFWFAYAANIVMVGANALTFRFAELIAFLGGTELTTGEIIQVREFPVERQRETARTLEAKAQPLLLAQFQEITERLLASAPRLATTPNTGGRYVSRARMEAMKEVKEGDDVERKIRAFWFPPYDGAYKVINGVKCTLVSRTILESLADPSTSSLFTQPSD